MKCSHKNLTLYSLVLLSAIITSTSHASVATFDGLALASNSFYAPEAATTFTSGEASFQHNFSDYGGGCCWNGFTYSNTTDTTTAGYGNQYSAITGVGVDGSSNYGVSNPGFTPSRVDFGAATMVDGAYFTNTTYAYLSMRDGDGFAKQFDVDDYFTLTVSGLDNANSIIGSLDISLADGTDILSDWLWADLTSLGTVFALEFSLTSSDIGDFGMNTPAYFAIDSLTSVSAVPVPAAVWLFGSGLLGLIAVARRS